MPERLSTEIQREVEMAIRSQTNESRILDVYATAEAIRRKHPVPEIRLEDIAAAVARLGNQYGCAVEFGPQHAEAREITSA
ncbi:MAG TPA: hypothetical protein VGN82_26365 [Bosea sp. (in: a-proteobacteria)]|jgi:hypothetical protein|uniref:hypothetical protein n=1 Tax=Bosea sp. (in: a-proteobacteria) TaxID=1871050 RepID=UPI002E0EE96B|nr:hypothetical protein [Bosea sp. (in: a-proteobacteria)]